MEIQTRRGVMHLWERAGDGAAVVLVHGWSVSGFSWQPVWERWRGPERLLALDLPGTGFSEKPETGYTLELYADVVEEVLDGLPSPRVLVGHSMGGTVAQLVALRQPSTTQGLVLVSPVPASGVPMNGDERAALRRKGDTAAGMAEVLGSMMAHGTCEGFAALLASSASVSAAARYEGLDAFCGANFAERLTALDLPVRVLSGQRERPLDPDTLQRAVVDRIRGATLQVIEDVAHYPHWESPEKFTRALEVAVRDVMPLR
ncbi:MAG: alpha/beta fold hydrolase [Myxococcota bacterium]